MVLIDSDGIVTHINEVAALIIGIEPADALGSPFDDLSSNHPHYLRVRDALRDAADVPRPTGRASRSICTCAAATIPTCSSRCRSIAPRATSLGTLLILQDVTYLRDQDRARSNLVATLSHELRTPLTSLALSAELLQREEAIAGFATSVSCCARSSRNARGCDSSPTTCSISRAASSPRSRSQRERLDLARRGRGGRPGASRSRREEKHVALENAISTRCPPVIGDPVKLSWVVSNLIGNALRYTPRRWTDRSHDRDGADDMVRLEVTDSGPGIAPEMRDYVFERFAQYGANGAEKGSAGLGLAIVKDIVEAHGGRIFVDSGNAPTGSRFMVAIAGVAGGLMARLLIVDDEKNIRANLATFFESLGHEVRDRRKRPPGAARCSTRAPFDLVLTDFRMAEMNGLELLREIKRRRARVPGHPDDRVRHGRKCGRRDEGRRLRLRDQAVLARADPASSSNARCSCRVCAPRIARCATRSTRRRCSNRSSPAMRPAAGDRAPGRRQRGDHSADAAKAAPARTCSRARSIDGVRATSKPFVVVNCTTLSEELLESELFGHVRGAFTGAIKDKPGRLEAADGGTVFLDEIADLTAALQTKFLRFVQEQSFERVGGDRTIHVDMRIIAASNRDLDARSRGAPLSRGSLLPPQRDHAARCRRCASAARTFCRSRNGC